MTRQRKWFWGLVSLLALGAVYLFYRGEVIVLLPEERVPVVKDPLQPPSGSNLVSTLNAGERTRVLACEDIKTDLVIRVSLHTGEVGYVRMGRYILERRSVSVKVLWVEPTQLTFSCKGMFDNPAISRYLP
jgi:hypothetical protein